MTPKCVRIAAIISQIFIIVWAAVSLIASFNQNNLIMYWTGGGGLGSAEADEKITSWAVIIYCVACLLLTISNLIMCNDAKFNKSGKLTLIPLVASAVTTAALPIAVRWVTTVQTMLVARVDGVEALQRLGVYNEIVSILSYLVHAAMIMAIAASAVYTYAKNHNKAVTEKE
ncbi:MAG: hypothetical protein IJZ61_05250 [Oscillospiraceae bacterium]|nr:hypothetical protein [Oscillospiraceae bacterium]